MASRVGMIRRSCADRPSFGGEEQATATANAKGAKDAKEKRRGRTGNGKDLNAEGAEVARRARRKGKSRSSGFELS